MKLVDKFLFGKEEERFNNKPSELKPTSENKDKIKRFERKPVKLKEIQTEQDEAGSDVASTEKGKD